MRGFNWSLGVAALLLSSSALAADSEPKTAPAPAWVKLAAIPDPNPARKDAPAQVLLINTQTRFDKNALSTYLEYVIQPQSLAGLQSTGTIAIPWNVGRTDLTINAIEIRRAGKAIDLLKGAELTVIRRENNLERAMLDGIRTVILPAKGLQIGDQVRVAVTYGIKPDAVGSHGEDIQSWNLAVDIGSLQRRFLVTPGTDVKWRMASRVAKPTVTTTSLGTEYLFIGTDLEAPKYPSAIKARDKANDIQFSAFAAWSEVAEFGQPLFGKARLLEPGSSLSVEAARIGAQTTDPEKRMMAALRLAQEQVRYVALLLGDGAYVPTSAAETWDRKFGDCKGKAALLLALLDHLGVKAEAMYVSAEGGEILANRLPSLLTFDHVIVKATIGAKSYYLDATDYGQRTAAEVSGSVLGYGLLLAKGGTLEKLPPIPLEEPLRVTELAWDGSKGVFGEIPFTARLTLRGIMAAQARTKKITAAKPDEFEAYLKDLVPRVDNKDLEISSQADEELTGDFVVTFKGTARSYWNEYEGLKGYRFAFSNDAAKWSEKFERDEGPFKDAPVSLNPNYWQREIETLILPADRKGFSIDAPALDRTIAATHIWRSVKMEGTRITSMTDFRRLGNEMSAEEARKAEDELEKIAESWAYVVAPRGLKPPKEEQSE
jgi:hypothetical protein